MKEIFSYDARLAAFKELIKKIEYLKYTLNSLVYWDKITYMPPKGIEYRTSVMSFLADEQYKLISGKEFAENVRYFRDNKKNDRVTDAMVRRICRNSKYISKVPEGEYRRYVELIARSEQIWETARKEKDFGVFKGHLEQIIDIFREFANFWGPSETPYDALLGYYEDGLTVAKVDEIVSELKPFLIDMIDQIKEAGELNKEPLLVPGVDRAGQEKLWTKILSRLGFSFEAGRIDVGAHPTILANSPADVRIVNSYREDELKPGIFNVLHSGGKGIYQQSIDEDLLGTFLAEPSSFAMEESIGRFYENIIGRSRGFWEYFYDDLCRTAPQMKKYTSQEIYRDANRVRPSLIRIEADELTYLLHIIIRYELEKDLINGSLSVEELQDAWEDKYKEYLGVVPGDDSQGILQDIHWAGGYVGYFPSYFVSNLAAAQIAAAIERDCGSLDKLAAEGNFAVIKEWLTEHIFRFGAMYGTEELIEKATGKPLGSADYISCLRKKFSEVYKLHH